MDNYEVDHKEFYAELDEEFDSVISEDDGAVVIRSDGAPDVRFFGELLGASSSRSQIKQRWTDLLLYQTAGGRYVCVEVGRTCIEGERDRSKTGVFDEIDGVQGFFGHRWLSRDLYENAGIPLHVDID